VTVLTGEDRYALKAELRPVFSIPPNVNMVFGLFVQKILKGVPGELVLWNELNRSMGVDDPTRKSACSALRTAVNDLRKLLSEWGSPEDGQPWLITRKRQGLSLNESVKWTLSPELKEGLTERPSVWGLPTDPSTMANNTDSLRGNASEHRKPGHLSRCEPGDGVEN
jgi:DNA-binding winged helix-turn-helix (wHTH) protein